MKVTANKVKKREAKKVDTRNMTATEIIMLQAGINYIPAPQPHNEEFLRQWERFVRRYHGVEDDQGR